MSKSTECIGFIAMDAEVIPAGVTVYAMDIRDKNSDYQKYADEYDIHFIFEDNVPPINFYTVPRVDIFATDGSGGLLGTVGATTDLDAAAPICHIAQNGACSLIADSLSALLQSLVPGGDWKAAITPCNGVTFYKSREEAQRTLDFLSLPHL